MEGPAARDPAAPDPAGRLDLSRRVFLAGSAVSTAAVVAGTTAQSAAADPATKNAPEALRNGAIGNGSIAVSDPAGVNLVEVVLRVNGREYALRLDPRATLLDTLRERLDLTGTKKGCDRGQCGACTVHVDGRRKLSCLTLAVSASEKAVSTIEGLARGGDLHPMQQAFLDSDGYQCGFCTPGQIMSAVALVDEGNIGSDEEIRENMSGNLCRCGAYANIRKAIRTCANGGSG